MSLSQMLNRRAGRLLDHLVGAGGQHTIKLLSGVVVHVPKKQALAIVVALVVLQQPTWKRQVEFEQPDIRSVAA